MKEKKLVIEPTAKAGIETILHGHIQGMKDILKDLTDPEFDRSRYPEWVTVEAVENMIHQYNDMYAVLRVLSTFNQKDKCAEAYKAIDEHISALKEMKGRELDATKRATLEFNLVSWIRMKFLIKMIEYSIQTLENTDNAILNDYLQYSKEEADAKAN